VSFIPQISSFNANTSKKKYLILISRCSGSVRFKGKDWYELHYLGFAWGHRIKKVYLCSKEKLLGQEYRIEAELIDISDQILFIKALNVMELFDFRSDIF
jgi:hypothetical protein